ncbi:MAG TPA: hypothetical protein DDW52_25910 [Planctomycetaceae bacterium]|nr:hypothetical protein [Planctomycetaceae bacterium]
MNSANSNCPDALTIQSVLNDSCDPAARTEVESHIDECEDCQRRLSEVAESGWRDLMPKDGRLSIKETGTGGRPCSDETRHKPSLATSSIDLDGAETTVIQNYEVVSEIARGGMGVVYRAIDRTLGRDVAIKLLSSDRVEDAIWLDRFHREARLTSALNHPNVVTIFEVGEFNRLPFFATEFVHGVTLRSLMRRRRLTIAETIGYAIQITAGLTAAHARGIVHRDLKPANLMVRDDGIVKILDFGLARPTRNSEITSSESSLSASGLLIGTIAYMSPEQARGREVDTQSDIFSLGTLLYFMLTGRQPFPGETPSDVSAAILTRMPKPLTEVGTQVPPDVRKLVMQCLSKDTQHRPSADRVHQELKRIAAVLTAESAVADPSVRPEPNHTASAVTQVAGHSDTVTPASPPAELSPIRYAASGDVNIAWQEIGHGPIDLVFVMGWVSHLEWFWKHPSFASFLKRLASFSRVILFDKRGTGLSDKVPVNELPTLETRMDDVRAVMEAAESERAVLCGVSEGGPLCTLFAATYPQKTIAIAMIGCYARRLWAEDYPWGPTAEAREVFLEELRHNWGGPLGIEDRAPTLSDDPEFRQWWASYLRMGASPGAAVALTRMNAQIDVRPILPSIQVPTLVIHRMDDRCLLVEEGRHMAELIPGAKFVELPGADHLPFVGDAEAILDEIEEFLTGKRHAPQVDRVLATAVQILLDVDENSDAQLNAVSQFHALAAHQADLFRGQKFTVNSDGLLITFDGPARAVRAANAICSLASRLDLNLRCGLDTGPCDIGPDAVTGPAVEQAYRIASTASLQSVVVSESVFHLVSGAGLEFVPGSISPEPDASEVRVFHLVR